MGAIDLGRLRALLEDEREVLLNGQYSALPGLGQKKERLVDRLEPSDLQDLVPVFERNQLMLVAALGGIRAVRDRRDAHKKAQAQLNTYSPDGVAQTISSPQNGAIKRS